MTPEPIEVINRRLKERYGRFSTTNFPLYRVVWGDDEIELIWTSLTKEGFDLTYPELISKPKYRQWAPHVYFLERVLERPDVGKAEGAPAEGIGYEPLWCFMDHNQNPLPPKWEVCEIVIESIMVAAAKAVGTHHTPKYKDPYSGLKTEEIIEKQRQALDSLEKDIFGNESPEGTALAHGWGVSLNNSERNKEELK